jgi:hypothetical protein
LQHGDAESTLGEVQGRGQTQNPPPTVSVRAKRR